MSEALTKRRIGRSPAGDVWLKTSSRVVSAEMRLILRSCISMLKNDDGGAAGQAILTL